MKTCDICNKSKSDNYFDARSFKYNGGKKICSTCKEQRRVKYWYRNLLKRASASNYNKDNDVNAAYLKDLFKKQFGKCYWLGIDLDTTMQDSLRTPSLDRLDNSKGYIVGNVVLSSRFANLGRNTATVKEFNEFIDKYIKP